MKPYSFSELEIGYFCDVLLKRVAQRPSEAEKVIAETISSLLVEEQGKPGVGAKLKRPKRKFDATKPPPFLTEAASDMYAALQRQEDVDDHIAACDNCCDGAHPELCSEGFPIADEARLMRWTAINKAEGKPNA